MAGARTVIAGGKRGLEKKEPSIRTFAICSTGPRFIAQRRAERGCTGPEPLHGDERI